MKIKCLNILFLILILSTYLYAENVLVFKKQKSRLRRFIYTGESLYKKGKYAQALTLFQEIYGKTTLFSPRLINNLSKTWIKLKEYDLSIRFARYVVQKSRNQKAKGIAYKNIAEAYQYKKDLKSALKYFKLSNQENPDKKTQTMINDLKKKINSDKYTYIKPEKEITEKLLKNILKKKKMVCFQSIEVLHYEKLKYLGDIIEESTKKKYKIVTFKTIWGPDKDICSKLYIFDKLNQLIGEYNWEPLFTIYKIENKKFILYKNDVTEKTEKINFSKKIFKDITPSNYHLKFIKRKN